MKQATFATVNDYVACQPKAVASMLRKLRAVIRSEAPEAEEHISYQMPAYKYHGRLVYFAAFKNHIGFYPLASGIAAFKKDLSEFQGAKGSVRFPIGEPLPLDLIARIVRFRMKENLKKSRGVGD